MSSQGLRLRRLLRRGASLGAACRAVGLDVLLGVLSARYPAALLIPEERWDVLAARGVWWRLEFPPSEELFG